MKRILFFAFTFFIWFIAEKSAEAAELPSAKTDLKVVVPPYIAPTILSPAAGQRFYAQTPIAIKLAPPQGLNVTDYLVSIERKDTKGNWIVYTRDPFAVAAAQAQSAAGYTGFVVPTAGAWRLTALALRPAQSRWSPWVEFTVVAPAPLNAPAATSRPLTK